MQSLTHIGMNNLTAILHDASAKKMGGLILHWQKTPRMRALTMNALKATAIAMME